MTFIVTKTQVGGTVESDSSLNKKSKVSLIHGLQVLAWCFKIEWRYFDIFAEVQLKPDTVSLMCVGGEFSKYLCISGSP